MSTGGDAPEQDGRTNRVALKANADQCTNQIPNRQRETGPDPNYFCPAAVTFAALHNDVVYKLLYPSKRPLQFCVTRRNKVRPGWNSPHLSRFLISALCRSYQSLKCSERVVVINFSRLRKTN